MSRARRLCAAMALGAALVAATAANASDCYWAGGTSSAWDNTGNWTTTAKKPTNDGAYFRSDKFHNNFKSGSRAYIVQFNAAEANAWRTYFNNCGSASQPIVLRASNAAYGLTGGDSKDSDAKNHEGIYIGTYQTGGNAGTDDNKRAGKGNAYVRFESGTYATRNTYSYFFLGNNSYDGHMTVAGATINASSDFKIFSGSLTIESGTVNVTYWTRFENNSRAKAINLNGGTLHTYRINKQGGSGEVVNFNGGTLRIKTNDSTVIESGIAVKVKANGGTINVNGTTSTIPASFSEDSSSTGGGMKFIGGGTLTLGGSIGYTGGTTIAAGTTLQVDTAAKKDALLGSGLNTLKVIPPSATGDYTLITITGSDEFSDDDLLRVALVPDPAGTAMFSISTDRKSLMLTVPYLGGEINQTTPTLVFPGATLADLATHTIRARFQGSAIDADGTEATFFNRVETVEDDVLTKVTYQLQIIDENGNNNHYTKAAKVEFTADADGVYAKLIDGDFRNYGTPAAFGTDPLTSNPGTSNYIPYDFRLVEPANAISVNFTYASGNSLETTSSVRYGAGDFAVPYSSWNNMASANNTTATFGGATVKITKTSGSYLCSNLNSAKDVMYGYPDDNTSGYTVDINVTNIPYEFYRIVTYHASDNAGKKFGHVTINGVNYTGGTDATVKGNSSWGATGASNYSYGLREGVNYLVSDIMLDSSVTITGHRDKKDSPTCRGSIAAIQVVEYVPETYTATISDGGSKSLSALSWDKTFPAYLTENNRLILNVTEDATLDIDVPVGVYAITFNVAEGKTLTLSGNNIEANYITATGLGKTVVANASQLAGTVKGDGTIVYDGFKPGTSATFTDAHWTGTVWVKNIASSSNERKDWALQNYGNAGSTLRFTNVNLYFPNNTTTSFPGAVDIDGAGLNICDGYAGAIATIARLTGDGTFSTDSTSANACGITLNDVSGFTGTMVLTKFKVIVGTSTGTSEDGVLQIDSGKTVTIADSKTWTAAGGMVLNGTLNIGAGATAPAVVSGTGTVAVASGTGTINGYGADALLTLSTAAESTLAIVDNTLEEMTVGVFANNGTIDLTGTALEEARFNFGSGVTEVATGTILYPATFRKFVVSPADQTVRSLAAYTVVPALPEGAAYYVTLAETREEFGKGSMTVNNCAAGVNMRVARPDGTQVDVLSSDGAATLSEAPQIAGAATAFDATYTNTVAYAYRAPGWNAGSGQDVKPPTYNNTDNDETTGMYILHHPWVSDVTQNITELGDFTLVVVGKMSPSRSTQFLHIGSSSSGLTGLLITTTENEDEVLIAKNTGNAVDAANGVRASVPNAATARHAYMINKKGTVFEVWVDGVKRGQFDAGDGFTLGSTSSSGIQIGSDISGSIKNAGIYKGVSNSPETETGVVNLVRLFDYSITEAQAEAVFNAYPYVSEGGLYTRTLAANGTFSETDAWAKDGDANLYAVPAGATVDDVFYNPSATLTVNAAATLGVNADVALDTLTVGGSATLTFAADGTHTVTVVGAAIINSPVTNEYGALNMSGAPVQLGENGAICFDCSAMDVSKVYAVTRFQLTGLIDRDDEKVTFIQPVDTDRSYEFVYNTTGSCYDLIVTPLHNYVVIENYSSATPSLTGDNILVGAGGLDLSTLSIPANATFTYDPIATPIYVYGTTAGAFTIGEGVKIKLAGNYADMTLGRVVLFTYKEDYCSLPENLNGLFDASTIAPGAEYTVTIEDAPDATFGRKQLVLTVGNYERDAKEIRILPVGDSITQGVQVGSGDGTDKYPQYRSTIAARLAASGYKPKLLGVWKRANYDASHTMVPEEWSWHCGISAERIIAGGSRGGVRDNMHVYLDIAGDVNAITFLIGTNDLGAGTPLEDVYAAYTNLMFATAAQRPNAKIIGATILDRNGTESENHAKVVAFNALLKADYTAGRLPASFVLLDLFEAVPLAETGNFLSDNLHLNWKGCVAAGDAFAGAIKAALPLTGEGAISGAPDATVTDEPQTALGAASTIPAAYLDGMTHMFTINAGATNCFTSAPYTTTNANILLSRPVSKAGYYMELVRKGTNRRRYVWVDFDATGKTLDEIDFPWTGANLDFVAGKMHVYSNDPYIHNVAADDDTVSGVIEGTWHNYSGPDDNNAVPADVVAGQYGWNDTMGSGNAGYGGFQAHRILSETEAEVLFAWNAWGGSKASDVDEIGIGSFGKSTTLGNSNFSMDYTFTGSTTEGAADMLTSDAYQVRRFEIWVKVDGAPRRGYWTGLGGDGDFDNAANWEDGVVPSSGDDLFIIPSSGTLNNNLENFAPKSITFQEGSGSVTIGGNAITGVAVITNLSSSSHTIDVLVAFADKILVVQPAMSWEQKTEPSIRFAGGVTGTTFAEGTARYLNGYFTLSTGEGWVANTQGSNNRWGIPANSSLTTPETTDTVELITGNSSSVFTAGVVRASTRLLCYNYGEYVVTNELVFTLPGADKHLARQYSDGAFKFEKITLGDQGAAKWFYFANEGNYNYTKNIWIGAGGLNFADGAQANTAYSCGQRSGDVVYLRPWHSDYTIETKPGAATDVVVYYETHIGTDDENGVARTVTCNGRIRNPGTGRAIVEGSGTFVVNGLGKTDSDKDNGTWTVTDGATLALTPNGNLGIGTATVNSGATLALPETGTVTLTGPLTLNRGAKLKFHIDALNDGPKLNMNGKALTLPAEADGTVTVAISSPANKVMRTLEPYVLISNGGLDDSDLSKFALDENSPSWVGRLEVKSGNLLLYSGRPGLAFSVR